MLSVRREGQGRPFPGPGLRHPGDKRHGGRDQHRARSASRGRRRSSCCCRTTTRTASGRARCRARRAWTSRATLRWRPSGSTGDAVALIKETNPLPSVCGRVCTRPCEVTGCRRNLLDEAVGIDYIKRYLTDLDLGAATRSGRRWRRPTGRRWPSSARGPAGCPAPTTSRSRATRWTCSSRSPKPGGMLRYGIPEYRLPKDVLDLEIDQILGLGVTLKTNTSARQGLHRREPEAGRLPGDLPRHRRLAQLAHAGPGRGLAGRAVGHRVPQGLRPQQADRHLRAAWPWSGGGNTAIDCARTALRLGVDEVRLLYRRTQKEMPANERRFTRRDSRA